MIVKIVIRENDFSVWDKEDNRLYYSDVRKEIDFAQGLVDRSKTNYFMATWKNKIITMVKPVGGYSW